MTFMYDCEGANAQWVHDNLPKPSVMAWYGTGSSGIPWTPAQRALFAGIPMVEIDQGGAGTPVESATVRDVENGAWSPGQAVNTSGWTAARKTIYCSRNTLGSVLSDGWKGDIWLAWPGWSGEALPSAPGCTYVAVQDQFDTNYDHSTILDTTWPLAAAKPSLTVTERIISASWPIIVGADHYIVYYTAPGSTVKVAIDRPPQPAASLVAVAGLAVPGSHSGVISIAGVVHSVQVPVGTFTLP